MRSMTGYGRVQLERDGREVTVELKAVNHRFLDLAFRMPRALGFAEDAIRKQLSARLTRGHVDINIFYVNRREDARKVEVDTALLAAYQQAIEEMQATLTGIQDDIPLADYTRLPDVLRVTFGEEDQEAVLALLGEGVEAALSPLIAMREAEGHRLAQDLGEKLAALAVLVGQIAQRAPGIAQDYRTRLTARVEELLGVHVEEARLLQEVCLFADRVAVDEELVRLKSHFVQFRTLLFQQEASGKQLDFLIQELNREVNTIGSKASDAQVTAWVVEGKNLIEKLREQIQNLE